MTNLVSIKLSGNYVLPTFSDQISFGTFQVWCSTVYLLALKGLVYVVHTHK